MFCGSCISPCQPAYSSRSQTASPPLEGTEKVKSTFRLKVNGGEIVVFTLLFLSNIALLRRFVKSEVINRKHFPFLSFKMGTFSVPSKGERQFVRLPKSHMSDSFSERQFVHLLKSYMSESFRKTDWQSLTKLPEAFKRTLKRQANRSSPL